MHVHKRIDNHCSPGTEAARLLLCVTSSKSPALKNMHIFKCTIALQMPVLQPSTSITFISALTFLLPSKD